MLMKPVLREKVRSGRAKQDFAGQEVEGWIEKNMKNRFW